jgi:hypothetical protein
MNTDERRLKTIALSAFISVDRRLNLPFPDFFSSLFQAGAPLFRPCLDIKRPRRRFTSDSCLLTSKSRRDFKREALA